MANSENALFDAVRSGNVQSVKQWIDSRDQSYTPETSHGYNLLREALINEQTKIAKLLFKGYKLGSDKKIVHTPLHFAAKNGDVQIVKLLLNRKANVNATGDRHSSPLHFAAWNGNEEIMQLLLNEGADIHCRDALQDTPLHIAAEKDREEAAKLLLDHGSNVDDRNVDNKTVLRIAVEKGNSTIVKRVLESRASVENDSDKNCLNVAIRALDGQMRGDRIRYRKRLDIVDYLLQYDFSVDREDTKDSESLLFVAVEHGYTSVVENLLKLVTSLDTINKSNCKRAIGRLYNAVKNGYARVVELLLKSGVDVNAKDIDNKTPLFYALRNEDASIIELLLANGAEIKKVSQLVSLAVTARKREILRVLLRHDIDNDINASDEYDRTSLHYTATIDADVDRMREAAELLLSRGAKVDATDIDGRTALYVAAQKGYAEIVEVLCKYGANVNSTDKYGQTPLHVAADTGKTDAVRTLLKYGADMDIRDNYGKTAYQKSYQTSARSAIERHTIMMDAAKISVNEENLLAIRDRLGAFRDDCTKEIDKMRDKRIDNDSVNLYDILTMDVGQLSLYGRNESIERTLDLNRCKDIFPIYYDIIDGKLARAKIFFCYH